MKHLLCLFAGLLIEFFNRLPKRKNFTGGLILTYTYLLLLHTKPLFSGQWLFYSLASRLVPSTKDSIWLLCQRQQLASKSPEAENDKRRRRRSDGGDCLGGRSCKIYSHADCGFRNTERELSSGLGTGVKKKLPDAGKAASSLASLTRPSLSWSSISW
jgi:hypothetical protein